MFGQWWGDAAGDWWGEGEPEDQAGFRSLLGFWVGGAAAPPAAPVAQAGYRSLLGFWLGGAGSTASTPPVVPSAGGGFRIPVPRRPRRDDDEEVLIAVIAAFLNMQNV